MSGRTKLSPKLSPKLRAILNGELRCTECDSRPPATRSHRRCWQCSRTGTGVAPPCKGCGEQQWFSGWCRVCHPSLQRPDPTEPRSCRSCLAWGVLPGPTCKACSVFDRAHPTGICRGCGREAAVRDAHCRLCRAQAQHLSGPSQWDTGPKHFHRLEASGHQLFFAQMLGTLWARSKDSASQPRVDQPVSTPVDTIQPELFTLPFAEVPWRILDGDQPRLDRYHQLLSAVGRVSELRGWSQSIQEHVRNTLRSLIATQPSDARIYPATAVLRLGPGSRHSVTRTLELLTDLGLLTDDRPDPDDTWVRANTAMLPSAIRRDVEPWLNWLRHGNARRRPVARGTWRGYYRSIRPVLQRWAQHHETLREIDRSLIIDALTEPRPRGGDNHTRAIALRSLFRFLKARKRIFTNPATRLPADIGRGHRSTPVSTAPERRGVDPGITRPCQWLVTVLVRHHALPGKSIADLTLHDIELDGNTFTANGKRRPLDTLTRQAVQDYLDYRARRWPTTRNQHLFLSKLSALTSNPVSNWWINERIATWGSTLTKLRQERILEEAAASGEPDAMHLAMMFGLHPNTAQRYVDAIYEHHDPNPNPTN